MIGFRKAILAVFALGLALFLQVPTASAATITFDFELAVTGAGIGAVLTTLDLQQPAGSTVETGGVLFNGTTDVESGDAKPAQSQTRTVTELAVVGIDATDAQFALVLDINEANPSAAVSLDNIGLNFWTPTGTFTATYVGPPSLPISLTEASQGQGSAGFLFRVTLTQQEKDQFFGDSTSRVGAFGSLSDVSNGPDTFYFAEITGVPPPRIPEPSTMILLGSGLLALGISARRRRQK